MAKRCLQTDGVELAPAMSDCSTATTEALELMQRQNRELRAALKTMPWPSLVSFEAYGQTHDLPYRPAPVPHAQMDNFPNAGLQFLSGFFDGDGCVRPQTNLSGCRLIVAQSFRKVAVLLSFLEVFGGTISRHSNGKGLCQPMLCWHVGGFPARLAAHALAANSITKRKQLQLAAAWPWERCGQEACRDELRALKKYDSAEAGPCSLGYFTGFFDAEGCLCHLGGARLSLQVKQKFPTVLQCLREFLAENYGCVHLYGYKTHSALSVSRTSICKEVLRAMLSSGLICKAEQAKLAIGLTPQNSLPVRLALGEQVGNQSFGRRLDEDGLERARKIQSAMSRATVLKDQGRLMEADTKLQQVQLMKGKHKLLNALRENEQLRQYIGNIRALQSHTDQPLFSVGKLWAL